MKRVTPNSSRPFSRSCCLIFPGGPTARILRGAIFLRAVSRPRSVYGQTEKFQSDPRWRDLILFYEYFHGDDGRGVGANHQTGWTGLAARFIQAHHMDAKKTLESGIRLIPQQEIAKSQAAASL